MSAKEKAREILKLNGSISAATYIFEQVTDEFARIYGSYYDGDIAAGIVSRLIAENIDKLIDGLAVIYCEYYTDDELDQLLGFFNSSLGKKVMGFSFSPGISSKIRKINTEWSEALIRQFSTELESVFASMDSFMGKFSATTKGTLLN